MTPPSDTELPYLDARDRQTTVLTTRLMRNDIARLRSICAKRDDGTTVPILISTIVHEGVRKLNEVEA